MYRDLLVGSTGFVGGNLRAKHTFAAVCHSSDIAAQYGTQPDLCVYAGVPAAMFLANADPKRTWKLCALPGKPAWCCTKIPGALFPALPCLPTAAARCEDDAPDTDGLPAYGRNRLQLEQWVRRILTMPCRYACHPCTARALRKTSCSTCTPSPRLC